MTTNKEIRIGIIGYGYWGRNLVRNFRQAPGCVIAAVAESHPEARDLLKRNYPDTKLMDDSDELFSDPGIDAVVIATPVLTHYSLARKALMAGKHVLIEKPMTTSVTEAAELVDLAGAKGLVILVDHTFVYTNAVRKMRELLGSGVIGTPKYFDSTRINLGLFQPDVNVLWDLASHDISILNYLIEARPVSVNATGISHTGNGIENIAYLTVLYETDLIAHIHCSWASPVKIRQTLIGGDRKMIIYNDLETTEKLRIYDTGYNVTGGKDKHEILIDYRTGDITIPKIGHVEALSVVARNFIDSINGEALPFSGGRDGLAVVRILEAAQVSIRENGRNVKIS